MRYSKGRSHGAHGGLRWYHDDHDGPAEAAQRVQHCHVCARADCAGLDGTCALPAGIPTSLPRSPLQLRTLACWVRGCCLPACVPVVPARMCTGCSWRVICSRNPHGRRAPVLERGRCLRRDGAARSRGGRAGRHFYAVHARIPEADYCGSERARHRNRHYAPATLRCARSRVALSGVGGRGTCVAQIVYCSPAATFWTPFTRICVVPEYVVRTMTRAFAYESRASAAVGSAPRCSSLLSWGTRSRMRCSSWVPRCVCVCVGGGACCVAGGPCCVAGGPCCVAGAPHVGTTQLDAAKAVRVGLVSEARRCEPRAQFCALWV